MVSIFDLSGQVICSANLYLKTPWNLRHLYRRKVEQGPTVLAVGAGGTVRFL